MELRLGNCTEPMLCSAHHVLDPNHAVDPCSSCSAAPPVPRRRRKTHTRGRSQSQSPCSHLEEAQTVLSAVEPVFDPCPCHRCILDHRATALNAHNRCRTSSHRSLPLATPLLHATAQSPPTNQARSVPPFLFAVKNPAQPDAMSCLILCLALLRRREKKK